MASSPGDVNLRCFRVPRYDAGVMVTATFRDDVKQAAAAATAAAPAAASADAAEDNSDSSRDITMTAEVMMMMILMTMLMMMMTTMTRSKRKRRRRTRTRLRMTPATTNLLRCSTARVQPGFKGELPCTNGSSSMIRTST